MPIEMVIQNVLGSVVAAIVILGVVFSPIGRAVGHRIMHGKQPKVVPGLDDPRLDEITGEMTALRGEVAELHERLDFAERLLAQARERGQLGAGNGH